MCNIEGAQYINNNGESSYGEPGEITLVPIRIYISGFSSEDSDEEVEVNYYNGLAGTNEEGYGYESIMTINSSNYIPLSSPTNFSSTYDGFRYIFLGWSVNPSISNSDNTISSYLDLSNSTNLYDTKEDSGVAISGYTEKAYKLGLLGTGDNTGAFIKEIDDSYYQPETATEKKVLNLYAVYCIRGFDTVVAAQENGDNIIGVSDWKADQLDAGYQDSTKEKWLGSIDVNIYKDGEPWTENETLYFSYHNDDAADLNIKFIWEEYVENYIEEYELDYDEALLAFMSNVNGEGVIKEDGVITDVIGPFNDINSVFPPHDQYGHYILDGADAIQGGSEDGLLYAFNWIARNGGQLDNVIGGQTVNLYVTSLYNAKYYLVDSTYGNINNANAITDITAQVSDEEAVYSTTGTVNLFNKNNEEVEYSATMTNSNSALINPDILFVNNNENGESIKDYTFNPGELARGGASSFSYWYETNSNIIPLAQSPANYQGLIPQGKSLVQQSQNNWLLIGPQDQKTYPYSTNTSISNFEITGTYYGSGNTTYATAENVLYGGEDPYTFNFYAFLDQGTTPTPPSYGNLVVEKNVLGEISSTETFNFTITFLNASGAPLSNSSITYLKDGEKNNVLLNSLGQITLEFSANSNVTFLNLLYGTQYLVQENEVANYVGTWNSFKGSISSPEKTITCTNSLEEEGTGSLTIQKLAPEATATESFNFAVTFTNSDGSYYSEPITYIVGEESYEDTPINGIINFKLSAGESASFINLPYETNYVLKEVDLVGYSVNWSQSKGNITADNANQTVTATNTKIIPPSEAQISISKEQALNNGIKTTDQLSVVSEDNITYYLNITNTGNSVANNVTIIDPIPSGLTVLSNKVSDGGIINENNSSITWLINSINPGETITVSFTVEVPKSVTNNMIYRNIGYVVYNGIENPSNEVKAITHSKTIINTTTITNGSPKTGIDIDNSLIILAGILVISVSIIIYIKKKVIK